MKISKDITSAMHRLYTLISNLGYECEIIDEKELFVINTTLTAENGDEIEIFINVTPNGKNHLIGEGNYIAFEVFMPCSPISPEEEMVLCNYIMKLLLQVDLTTIQYVHESKQILISRVDCITPQLPDNHIINHIIIPTINEFKHIFSLIERNSFDEEPQSNPTHQEAHNNNKYIN